jgi:hypothetical protein
MDNLKCPICLDQFQLPVSIGCGHSFCKDCLQDSIVLCPVCRAEITQISPNFTLRSLLNQSSNDQPQARSRGRNLPSFSSIPRPFLADLAPPNGPLLTRWAKALFLGLVAIVYLFSPIDLLPDVMGPFGFVDDIVVLAFLFRKIDETLNG